MKRPRLAESTGTYMLAKVKVSFPETTFAMVSRPSKYEEKSSGCRGSSSKAAARTKIALPPLFE